MNTIKKISNRIFEINNQIFSTVNGPRAALRAYNKKNGTVLKMDDFEADSNDDLEGLMDGEEMNRYGISKEETTEEKPAKKKHEYIDRKNLKIGDVDDMLRIIMMINDRIRDELGENSEMSHDVEVDLDEVESILYANLIQK